MSLRMTTMAAIAVSALIASCSAIGAGRTEAPATMTPTPTVPAGGSPPATASSAGAGPSTPAPASTPSAVPSAGGSPAIDPANFTTTIDNPWFPLVPGTTYTYHGTKDGKAAVDSYAVTDKTRTLDGVVCRVVEDRLVLDGKLEEETSDYYVQDVDGNVWYFGEDTKELDPKGHVTSREGTWHAGVDGAVPGIFMEADPTVGHAYPQEFYRGHAEDHFEVIDLNASVKVPFGAYSGVVQTKEWTPLEPGVLDHKYWVRGIGEVREVAVMGPTEELVLVD
ncbi:MAG TPA: hypothetical protein VLR93_12420, partial [Patescibacteria group bacterium]|nr:hypothetical protein [Patescibacteria group bacterium]